MKVLVVGAGPSGCIAAASALKENPVNSVSVCEEHSKIGYPEQCGGLVSEKAMDWFKGIGVEYRKSILNRIKGTELYCKKEYPLLKNSMNAFVVRRSKFDRRCSEFAEKMGARITLGESINSNKIMDKSNSSFIIGADGPFSTVAKTFKFPEIRDYAVAYQSDIYNLNLNEEEKGIVQVHLYDKSFGWLIPINEERAHAGVIFFKNPDFKRFEWFLDKIKNKFDKKKLKTGNFFTDCVPFSPRPQIQKKNVYLVGDAAGQVKATSGGGIYYGCKSAWLAGRTIGTGDYEKRWKNEIGKDLNKHLFVRNIINKMDLDTIQLFLRASSLLGIGNLLRNYDMERIQSLFTFKP